MKQNSNLHFYEQFAGAYQSLYASVDENAAVERWVRLLEDGGLIQAASTRLQNPPAMVDVGCGPGRHLIAWHEGGFRPTGLDGSPAMLSVAERNLRSASIQCPLVLSDILTFGGAYEATKLFPIAVSHLFFPNLFPSDQLSSLMEGISRLLKPGGIWMADWRTDLPDSLQTHEAIDIDGVTWRRGNAFDPRSRAFVQTWSTADIVLEERFWHHELPQIEAAARRAGLHNLIQKRFPETPASVTSILQK